MLRIFLLLHFTFLSNKLVSPERIEDIITCLKGTECDEFADTDNYTETYEEGGLSSNNFQNVTVTNFSESTSSINLINTTQNPQSEITTTAPSIIMHKFDPEIENDSIYKKQSDICECDLTVIIIYFYNLFYI